MKKLAALIILMMLFSALPLSLLGARGDTPVTGERTECDSSLQMIPVSQEIGGGTIHWRITGRNAQELRMLILERLDNATIGELKPNDTAQGRQPGKIDEAEVQAYVGFGTSYLQHYLEGNSKDIVNSTTHKFETVKDLQDHYPDLYYQGVLIRHSALSNSNIYSDTSGLIGTNDSVEYIDNDIDIYMTIRMHENIKASQIYLSNPKVLAAPFECLTKWGRDNSTGLYDIPVDRVTYEGTGTLNHYTIDIGFDSFSYPEVQKGNVWLFRTPAGEVLSYSVDVEGGTTPKETIRYSSFDPLENPQILFIIVIILGYLTVAIPTHFYLSYRDAYPKRYRMEAKKIKWLHWTARIFLLLLIIFYFWPIIGPIYFSGPIVMVLGTVFVISSAGLGKYTYDRATESIPKEYFEEEREKKKRIPAVPAAPQPAPTRRREPSPPPMLPYDSGEEKIHCIRCGALITIKEGENLLKVKCPVCGAIQKRVERSYNHLILDSELKNTYNMLADFLRDGDTALCISTTFPGKLKRTYGLSGKIKCIWLSSAGGKDTINPADVQKISDVIERFAQKYPASIILFDGLEYLVIDQGFDEAMKLVKKALDVCSMMDITLLVPINPAALTTEEITTLKTEFDRVEALEDKDEREFY